MNGRQTLSGRKPHGRLDCDYAISGLLKAQPMFDFGQLDRMKPQAPLPPWKVGGPGAGGRCRRLVAPSDWVWKQPESSEFESRPRDERRQAWHRPCSNNSAARGSCGQGADSERQRIEQRLRQLYGDQLFRPGKYVAPDQLGPALEPRKLGASSVQSIRARMLGPLPREVFNESGRSGAAASKGRLTPDVAATLRLCSSGATTRTTETTAATEPGSTWCSSLSPTGRRKKSR
ncbi:hypothetical protein BOX15_Mlig006860g2 [Macrostomum lignano]|uniref:Uncharacterized protein n=1 Tax=Macrostomum lignano TaxID=282301 RepID=A0A267EG75_9PLAT|nr:hypothetical protein BOX15_Mlig006860g2 [Macrostomum lignano]